MVEPPLRAFARRVLRWAGESRFAVLEVIVLIAVLAAAGVLIYIRNAPRTTAVPALLSSSASSPVPSPAATSTQASGPRLESPSPLASATTTPGPAASANASATPVPPAPSPVQVASPSPSAPGAPPPGTPMALGWDGIDGAVMMWGVASHAINTPGDRNTWLWNGTRWTLAAPGPSPVGNGLIVSDPKHSSVLLVQTSGYSQTGSTWSWRAGAWVSLAPATSPLITQNSSGAYSPELGRVVILSPAVMAPRCWTWDGSNWTLIDTPRLPPVGFGQVFYANADRAVEYVDFRDYRVWKFDGTGWDPMGPAQAVSPLVSAGMGRQSPGAAYDESRGRLVVFGGYTGSSYLNDTWTFDGKTWAKQSPASSPPGRDAGWETNLAFDRSSGRVLLYGGHGGADVYSQYGDTWAWDGSTWTRLAT